MLNIKSLFETLSDQEKEELRQLLLADTEVQDEEITEDKVEEEIIKHLRLKKLYVDYIIPATDRIIEMDQETGVEYKVVTKGAIILAVGYDNL